MKNNKGVTLVALVVTIIVLLILAVISIRAVMGDDGIVTHAIKMEVETVTGEVRDQLGILINSELLGASATIADTKEDISTKFNEVNLIRFLMTGKTNFDPNNPERVEGIACIEEYTPASGEEEVKGIIPKAGGEQSDISVKNIYRVLSSKLCPDGDKFGKGKNIKEGDIFTLEAVTEPQKNEDGTETGELLSTGKFELKYYDKDGKVEVLDTVVLYMTNQS